MGRGRRLICNHCNKETNMCFGMGFFFPDEYRDKVKEICDGKYGEEWKILYQSKEYVAVNAYSYLYYCKKCGRWEYGTSMDLYEPKKSNKIRKKKHGDNIVEEWGEISYVIPIDLEDDWKLLKAYNHNCQKCKDPMVRTDDYKDTIFWKLKCKDCGNELEDKGFFLWD